MLSISTFILSILLTSVLSVLATWYARSYLGKPTAKELKLSSELEQALQELSQYKQNINTHFETTAKLFNDLSKQYKNLYEHLKSSAKELCNNEHTANLLEYNDNNVSTKNKPVDTAGIKHNWHPTYFEARDAIDSADEQDIKEAKDSNSSQTNNNNPKYGNIDLNNEIDLDTLLADYENLDVFEQEHATSTETKKIYNPPEKNIKEKFKVITGNKIKHTEKNKIRQEELETIDSN